MGKTALKDTCNNLQTAFF